MAATQTPDKFLQIIRENRSSESNFETLQQTLQTAIKTAQNNNHASLADDLKEADETYAAAYKKAKETSGTAWPEFEKFVTQFERALTNAKNEEA